LYSVAATKSGTVADPTTLEGKGVTPAAASKTDWTSAIFPLEIPASNDFIYDIYTNFFASKKNGPFRDRNDESLTGIITSCTTSSIAIRRRQGWISIDQLILVFCNIPQALKQTTCFIDDFNKLA
jgi:hypothetical protein